MRLVGGTTSARPLPKDAPSYLRIFHFHDAAISAAVEKKHTNNKDVIGRISSLLLNRTFCFDLKKGKCENCHAPK